MYLINRSLQASFAGAHARARSLRLNSHFKPGPTTRMLKQFALLFIIIFPISLYAETDELLSFDFQKVKVNELIQLLAHYSHENIIISNKVPQQEISLHLQKVHWQEALQLILNSQGLSQRQIGNTIVIAPSNEIMQQIQQDYQLEEQQQQMAPANSEVIELKYAKAQDLATMLKDKNNNLLSAKGNVGADPRTNSLWIQDTPLQLKRIHGLINQLDQAAPQVNIEARIVTVDSHFEKELGVRFGLSANHHLSGTLSGANQLAGGTSPASVPLQDRLNFDFTNEMSGTGSLGLALFNLGNGYLLDMELSALQAEGAGEIIAKPSLVTANQQPALIQTGEDIPYQEKTSSGATNVAFKKAVLSLEVTPQITPDQHVLLNLHISQDKPSSKLVNGVPAIDTREINTQVLVNNNEVLVLGGIYEESENHQVERVPFLSDIPLLGRLFEHQYQAKDKRELLIFVRPLIMLKHPEQNQARQNITTG